MSRQQSALRRVRHPPGLSGAHVSNDPETLFGVLPEGHNGAQKSTKPVIAVESEALRLATGTSCGR